MNFTCVSHDQIYLCILWWKLPVYPMMMLSANPRNVIITPPTPPGSTQASMRSSKNACLADVKCRHLRGSRDYQVSDQGKNSRRLPRRSSETTWIQKKTKSMTCLPPKNPNIWQRGLISASLLWISMHTTCAWQNCFQVMDKILAWLITTKTHHDNFQHANVIRYLILLGWSCTIPSALLLNNVVQW